ncbi:response regulator [bacterium]|nr:response regulator [bacterium]
MPEILSALLAPTIAIVAVVFILIRLRFFSDDHPDGRYLFVFGGVLVIASAFWQTVKLSDQYESWFIPAAYGYIDISQILALALGVVLIAAALALYHDFWQTDREAIVEQQGKLSILEQLQEDARQPYQVIDLLSMGLREILLQWSECSGVVFLVHRERRQFVLIDSSRLDKQETALMEYLPLRRNAVAEALDDGRPVIGGSFTFVDRNGKSVPSRFKSSLVLPLVSGMEKLGGILLLSEEDRLFSRNDIKILAPVAGWLAERARSARLSRELSGVRHSLEESQAIASDLTGRLSTASQALGADEPVSAFCRALVGLADSQSVHLCGIRHGNLAIHGGSEPLRELSDNFRTALVGALDRRKPLILNQEAVDESGGSHIVSSTLVYPVPESEGRDALLLRKEAPPFVIDDSALKRLDLFSRLASLALKRTDNRRLDLARRIGFDKVLHLLTTEETGDTPAEALAYFARQVADIIPKNTLAVTMVREERGLLRSDRSIRCDLSGAEIEIQPGEGSFGRSIAEGRPLFVGGARKITAEYSSYRSDVQTALASIGGERGVPDLLAVCPISQLEGPLGVVGFFFYDVAADQLSELQRLVTLATGLFSLRLGVLSVQRRSLAVEAQRIGKGAPGDLVNRVNNFLSAIMASAELTAARDDLPGDARRQVKSIVAETEQLATLVKRAFSGLTSKVESESSVEEPGGGLSEQINQVLDETRISGNVYMAGGRPREIDLQLETTASTSLAASDIRGLFEGAVNRFATMSKDDETISVAVYQEGDYVYLDLSRHPSNFPPVKQVARFGEYRPASQALRERPGDVFLDKVKDEPCFYALDRHSDTPAFLSFKFPLAATRPPSSAAPTVQNPGTFSVLAIDDESIILDLVAAMCQSLGYEAATARSGEEGLTLARNRRFDLVLTDLAMPGLSGLDVGRELQALYPGLPVVLVTGWQASVDQADLDRAGISFVLSKPFRMEQLTDIIQSIAAQKN